MIDAAKAQRLKWLATLPLLLAPALSPTLSADEFTLKDGRKIVGTVIKKNEDTLVIELSPGNMLLLGQSDIKKQQQTAKGEAAYLEALKSASDTVESHLLMASVAHKNLLPEHERAHYERVVEMDPDNGSARSALGFVKNPKDGSWILRDEQMREGRGKILVGNRKYRFPELVAKEEAEEKFNAERNKLAKEIKIALSSLSNPRNAAKAQATLDGLQGPTASAAIAFLLYPPGSKNSPNASTQAMFIPILERLGDPTAARLLINFCLDPDVSNEQQAVRREALRVLKNIAPEDAFHKFMENLSSKKNATINLAAELLQELGDERAILPLIERLVTVERREFGGGQATNAGMSNGNISFSKGDPKVIQNVNIENPRVLGALTELTSQNFKYDKREWMDWYAKTYLSHDGDLRRDP